MKGTRENRLITDTWIQIRALADLSFEHLQTRTEWLYILKVMKQSNLILTNIMDKYNK